MVSFDVQDSSQLNNNGDMNNNIQQAAQKNEYLNISMLPSIKSEQIEDFSAKKGLNVDLVSTHKTAEYAEKGEYHKALDKNWVYYPVYIEKMKRVRDFLDRNKDKKILDLGCGEGVLVEEYKKKGFNITGLDFNYQSDNVIRGDITKTPFRNDEYDIILCLDVIEHLTVENQELAIREIKRILKPEGIFYATIPNLAHFASRLSFLLTGKLIRTADIHRHVGDRPFSEFKKLLNSEFKIEKTFGIFPSYPLLSIFTYFAPSKVVWWHSLVNRFLAYNPWCFLNFFICKKK